MRNVLVVLVPLCFGLTSGFIVPSGIQEILSDLENSNSIDSSSSKTRNMLLTKNVESTSTKPSTEKDVNDILNIFEQSQTKKSDVKERAYIHINQNDKKPTRNRPYPKTIPKNYDITYLSHLNKVFDELPRQFSIGYMSQNVHTNTDSNKRDFRCHAMKVKQKNLKIMGLSNWKGDTFNVLYPSATNSKGNMRDWIERKNYQNNVHADTFLLEELIKQKLDEKGNLISYHECDKTKKYKLNNQVLLEVTCRCGSNFHGS